FYVFGLYNLAAHQLTIIENNRFWFFPPSCQLRIWHKPEIFVGTTENRTLGERAMSNQRSLPP
ncbi:MAG: hypothetical protein ACYT04_000000100520, partial [Nostoc sp.]